MSFASLVTQIVGFIDTVVVPVIFSIASLGFLWGVFQYFFMSDGDAGKQSEARTFLLWGLIGLAVLFSTWGLVNLLLSTVGI